MEQIYTRYIYLVYTFVIYMPGICQDQPGIYQVYKNMVIYPRLELDPIAGIQHAYMML